MIKIDNLRTIQDISEGRMISSHALSSRHGSKSRDVGSVSLRGLGRLLARRPGERSSLRAGSRMLRIRSPALGDFRCPTPPSLWLILSDEQQSFARQALRRGQFPHRLLSRHPHRRREHAGEDRKRAEIEAKKAYDEEIERILDITLERQRPRITKL